MSAKTTTKPKSTKLAPVKKELKLDRATIIGKHLFLGGTVDEVTKAATVEAKGKVRTEKRDVVFLANILIKVGVLTRNSKGVYKKV